MPHLTQCVIGPLNFTCQMTSKSVKRLQGGITNVTDDRQTDQIMEKCVRTGGIACAPTAIPPDNTKIYDMTPMTLTDIGAYKDIFINLSAAVHELTR